MTDTPLSSLRQAIEQMHVCPFGETDGWKCSVCERRDRLLTLLTAVETEQQQIAALPSQWRAKKAQVDGFHATMGTGWAVCADELEALTASAQPPQDQG